ncbi:protein abrupt isoform X2 [Condylostylus longicornis]|uniref:protein abrupt isoform X2 n=1 Tax=Condylostylus longicornis TaxID=2530218 RepID=UPI00244E49C1|nr:protein abrupt isoform X2 [Condylostylus longicornis]
MTESTQLQTNENNNTSVVKMEAPPPPVSPAPSEQQYALKWNDFQTSILSSFRHLRDEEDFVDVTLACDQRSYRAHKVVLSACSPYFRKLLKANPCEHPIVILRDVKSEDVESLLRFMYNGEVHVNQEHLSDFLKTAQLLQVRGLADVNGSPTSMGPVSSNIPAAITSTSTTNTSYTNSNNNINNNTNNNNNNNNSNSGNNNNNNSNNNNNINNNLSTSSSSTTITPQPITANSLLLNASLNTPSSLNITNTNSNTSTSQSASSPAISIKTPLALSNSVSTTALSSSTTPAIQELKASPVRRIKNAWDIDERQNHLTPPPQKRIKSADLYRAQHGISPERFLVSNDLPLGQHPLHRERDRTRDSSRDTSRDRDRSLELRDTLLGQALENSAQQLGVNQKHPDLASLQAQSTGEDSNSSDTEPSDRGDGQLDGTIDSVNGSLDNRSHSFPSAFLGLQNIPGLLAGPSGMHSDNFVSRRSLEMRVRATDPRPCPKCGKIYRSAHTLRTHLEDKHTVCPGYRCVLCGTVAKSRNSLHSHMSRQHRGISTKDLPVLPMPSPFDPDLASRLLAKAGVKISAAELRARASPTSGTRRGDSKLDLRGIGDEDDDDDPEDLTTGYGHPNTTITRIRHDAMTPKSMDSLSKDMHGTPLPPTSAATGQSLLDYLQFITENTFGMGMSQEHAAAALHAAKMAQLNAMGHGLDKLPPGLLPPHLDLAKLTQQNNNDLSARLAQIGNGSLGGGLTIEPTSRRSEHNSGNGNNNDDQQSSSPHRQTHEMNGPDIDRRDPSEPMDLGLDNINQSGSGAGINSDNLGSDAEDNYSEDEGVHNT